MRAAHSSAALVVNAFAPWRERVKEFSLAGVTDFTTLRFEAVYPSGLGGTPPHLDMVADGATSVAVESKCLEYLTPKRAIFSRSYDTIADSRCNSPWFGLIEALRHDPCHYRYLDVAQLVKHSLGLMNSTINGEVILLHAYWEPVNDYDFQEFQLHRDEIEELQSMVRGAKPILRSLTYRQIWKDWATEYSEPWLRTHVDRLLVSCL